MGARERFNQAIKVNRRMRKAEEYKKKSLIHPALLPDWDDLSRDEQSDKLLKWTILTRKK
jgi:hypothetical protein